METIKITETRTIEDIAIENAQLKKKIANNLNLIKTLKETNDNQKKEKEWATKIKSLRKIFAFECNEKITPTIQQDINNWLEDIKTKFNCKLDKLFILNDFLYFKSNINIEISKDIIIINNFSLKQINPKFILKFSK